MTKLIVPLTRTTFAVVTSYGDLPANKIVVIISESYGEEGVFYPAQDVTIHGGGLVALRDLLNLEVPKE